jgi:hypothetical protein
MLSSLSRAFLSLVVVLSTAGPILATNPFTQYAVDFPDPNFVAAGQFPSNLGGAQDTIVAWATEMASHGPWSTFLLRHLE